MSVPVPSDKLGYGLLTLRTSAQVLSGFLTCDTCGALVADQRTELHDTWHRTQGQQEGETPA